MIFFGNHDFNIGDHVYIEDTEYEIWDGTIIFINRASCIAFVQYETDTETKYRWVSFDELKETA